jgi:hypothetical protein
MGRQVNFYMLPEDLTVFEEALKEQGQICFLPERLPSPKLQTLSTLAIPEMGKTWLGVYLCRETDLSNIVVKSIPKQEYWTIDENRSPVVQFDRCYYDGRIVRRGRLYFLEGFYNEEGHWVEKSENFIRWAGGLLRWIRKHYKKDPKTGFYVGPYAWEWVSRGIGRLALL